MFSNTLRITRLVVIVLCFSYTEAFFTAETPNISADKPNIELGFKLDAGQQSLLEDIIKASSSHVRQNEMDRLKALLQDLLSSITLPTIVEIRQEITTNVQKKMLMSVFSFGLVNQAAKKATDQQPSEKCTLQKSIADVLQKIDLMKYENLLRKNADVISEAVATTLQKRIPEKISVIAEIIQIIKAIEKLDALQKTLTDALAGHQKVIENLV